MADLPEKIMAQLVNQGQQDFRPAIEEEISKWWDSSQPEIERAIRRQLAAMLRRISALDMANAIIATIDPTTPSGIAFMREAIEDAPNLGDTP